MSTSDEEFAQFPGPVRRWLEDGMIYADNDFCSLAWAPTDDPEQVGKFGWYGPQQIGVEFMSREAFDAAVLKWGLR